MKHLKKKFDAKEKERKSSAFTFENLNKFERN